MTDIAQSFKIKFLPENITIMYAHLTNGQYTKTQDTPDGVKTNYIDIQEYASALATLLLRDKTKPRSNMV